MTRPRLLSELPAYMRDDLAKSAFDCLVCGKPYEFADQPYEVEFGVCATCCEHISNHYWKHHSGEYLTWPNERAEGRPRTKRQISSKLRFEVYERDGFKCVYCGSRKDLSCDHVTPESKGGATEKGNLVTSCKSCNSRKKTKSLADFWEVRRG